ncbi:unnamed protein product [Vitrella brassicaformis CCMP3155]|uniref:Protein kinase domain-containing protein n=1 Tax=Vitrella brassicaformis (strain CCMP3155) TaxID=1169540 RepID=A0A0G4EFM7_VITBC|nr:unnamed protein product [Vitrella brassicaformis CCMP3155]|eukprot:CEL94183.1 unnamed protein product [Vitrella brassicaformis CCMP3155]
MFQQNAIVSSSGSDVLTISDSDGTDHEFRITETIRNRGGIRHQAIWTRTKKLVTKTKELVTKTIGKELVTLSEWATADKDAALRLLSRLSMLENGTRNVVNIRHIFMKHGVPTHAVMERTTPWLSLPSKKFISDVRVVANIVGPVVDVAVEMDTLGVVHPEICVENLSLAKVGSRAVAKLAGLENVQESPIKATSCTCLYASPEELSGRLVTPAIHIWRMGHLTVELFKSKPLFDGMSLADVMDLLQEPEMLADYIREAMQELCSDKSNLRIARRRHR